MPSSSAEEEPFVEIEEARLRTFQQAGPPTRGSLTAFAAQNGWVDPGYPAFVQEACEPP